MITRSIESKVLDFAKSYPVVTITGPRQSGKTTLCKNLFQDYAYFNLEDPDIRAFAEEDPRGFLGSKDYMIIDEVQRHPNLISYIQGLVDKNKRVGQYILTGSHQLELSKNISQSLAGRTAIAKLLPFSFKELNEKASLDKIIYRGFYPHIIDRNLNPTEALSFYTNTYVERDVRQVLEIKNLKAFENFLKIIATYIGQQINKQRISNDTGVDAKTIDSWLSVLEASFVLFQLPPYYKNLKKRITKSSKLYFFDVGLASYLLRISEPDHVATHPLRGALFENLIVTEMIKNRWNAIKESHLYYYKDSSNTEVDIIEEVGSQTIAYEIKSSKTINSQFLKSLVYYQAEDQQNKQQKLIYTGETEMRRSGVLCTPYDIFLMNEDL